MWRAGIPWLVLGLELAVACGGRTERSIGRYQASAPTAGAVDHAGSPAVSSGGQSGAEGGARGDGGFGSEGGLGGDGGDGGGDASAGSAGASDACASQFAEYGNYRSQVLAEFASFGCMVDQDCRNFYDQSACDPACVPLTSGAYRGVLDRLNTFELLNCRRDCWPEPWPTCPAGMTGHCVAGECQ